MWLRLEKLEWDAAREIIESEMTRDPQLAKKLLRVGEARWSELYDETRGSPLALMHTLGLMRVRASLTFDGALEMLCGNRTPDLERFIFHEARQELTVNDQAALGALSFFAPSATFEAWRDVAEMSRNALETTIDRLGALSLVDVLTDEERYALHPLTRNFVHDELLADEQIAHGMGFRFARYWVAYAGRYGGPSSNYKTYDHLEAEWANLDAAAAWLWQTAAVQDGRVGDKSAAVMLNDLGDALNTFLLYIGRWDERVRWSTRAYQAMRALNNWSAAGWGAYRTAWIHLTRAGAHAAACWADRCAEAWARGGSQDEQAEGMWIRGLAAHQRQEYGAAERLLQAALEIWRVLEQDEDIARVLNSLGGLERERRRYDLAERYYCEALKLARKIDDRDGLVGYSGNLGWLALDRQRWAEARKLFEQELRLGQEIRSQELIARAQDGLACVCEAEGHPDIALPLTQEALAIYERLRYKDLPETRALVERLREASGRQ